MKFTYILLRFVRHFMPAWLTRYLLTREIIIKPGLETMNPEKAADAYIKKLVSVKASIKDKQILIFGYGGNYGTACELLDRGSKHITLTDLFAKANKLRNKELLPRFSKYLIKEGNNIYPNPEYITLVHGDIVDQAKNISVDIVLSISVFEHLDGVDAITKALASCITDKGQQVHFVDLKDHYPNQPYRMLTFKENTWRNWLNPTSNLNRFRLWDYQEVFDKHFDDVRIDVLSRDKSTLEEVKHTILPEYLSGDVDQDSVSEICVLAAKPVRSKN